MTRIVRVDATARSVVYVCGLCDARDVTTARVPAWVAAAAHLRTAHPGHPGASLEAANFAARARNPDR
jgi:hypothetical protein